MPLLLPGLKPLYGDPTDPTAVPIQAPPILTAASAAPPAPPELLTPRLLAPPVPGLAARAGMALADIPAFHQNPYESAGSRFGRGLLSGAAHGFSNAAVGDYSRQAQAVDTANKMNATQADRNNAAAMESWKARLADFYKMKQDESGRPVVNKAVVDAMPEFKPYLGQSLEPSVFNSLTQAHIRKQEQDRQDRQDAETKRHNLTEESLARDKAAKDAKAAGDPSWMQHLLGTTSSGQSFLDMSNLSPKEMSAAQQFAFGNGATPVNKAQMDKLAHLETARDNIEAMMSQAQSILPKSSGSRLLGGPANLLAGATQSNPTIAAWNTWRISAIQQLVALAGGQGSGVRINQAEIAQAVKNDIPEVTDTYAVAKRKADNLRSMFDKTEATIMGHQWSPTSGAVPKGFVPDGGAK